MFIVKNVPGLVEARAKMLPLAHRFAMLPDDVKVSYHYQDTMLTYSNHSSDL
jgi:hypothetical protein